MNGTDESNFRVLMARFRDEQPREFVKLLTDSILVKMDEGTCLTMEQFDSDDIRTSVILVVKGVKQATAMIEAMQEMETDTGESDEADPEGSDID